MTIVKGNLTRRQFIVAMGAIIFSMIVMYMAKGAGEGISDQTTFIELK
ncbi:MAG: hypothetical protein O7D29_04890 [Gemmatimonadetes bacterium]|nr:hypothetical protein [Gemmatimonadota bacterium]